MVNHSKCKECGKIQNVSELMDNPNGVGVICTDKKKCADNKKKSTPNK